MSSNGKYNGGITNKIGEGRREMRQLNSIICRNKIVTKTTTSKRIVERITTYGAAVWTMPKRYKDTLGVRNGFL